MTTLKLLNRYILVFVFTMITACGGGGDGGGISNNAPVANNDNIETNEDAEVNILLAGSDADQDTIYFNVNNPQHGSLTGTAPNLVYTPDLNYYGTDSFTFTVNDGTDSSSPATINIIINPGYDAPVVFNQNINVDEDTTSGITLTVDNIEGNPLSYSVTEPSNGTLSGTAPDLTYAPNANYYGSDNFSFTVNDGTADSNTALVSITVNAINDAPVANNQNIILDEDTPTSISLTTYDTEGDALSYSVTTPLHGTLNGTAPNLTYTPDADYYGSDSFSFTVNDGTADSNTA
ncbi:MAG: Ig-like domain-containing protein, partial [Gammaproteobacteria bacterium]|nr:Ig-like domain-containing protein [Gammaproteobacteria bacterium]